MLFMKIYTQLPSQIAAARRNLERGMHFAPIGEIVCNPTFESNIAYALRFMIDTSVVGCNWIELPAGKYLVRNTDHLKTTPRYTSNEPSISNCQIEVDVMYSDMISHSTDGEFSGIAPLRILSFDIECAGRKGVFPDPKIDPVIQIANMVTIQGGSSYFSTILANL